MIKLWMGTWLGIGLAGASAWGQGVSTQVSGACSTGESWTFAPPFTATWQEAYRAFLTRAKEPYESLPESFALKADAAARGSDSTLVMFSDYWKGRIYFDLGLIHMANDTFNAIASQPVSASHLAVQLAALECLSRIHHRAPRLGPTPQTFSRLSEYGARVRGHGAVLEAALVNIHSLIAEKRPRKEIDAVLALTQGFGAYDFLAQAMKEIEMGSPARAAWFLDRFVALSKTSARSGKFPSSLKRYAEASRLLLARAWYQQGNFKKALEAFKGISRESNFLVQALSEQAWVQLMEGRYNEVVGTVVGLQQGGLRNTFAPEPIAVLTMALNEICQYKEALRTIQFYHRKYKPAYVWLKQNSQTFPNPYGALISFLQTKQTGIPKSILSDWVGSPIFIGLQDELNGLFDERKAFGQLLEVASDYKQEFADAPAEVRRAASFEGRRTQGLKSAFDEIQGLRQTFLRNSVYLQRTLVQKINDDLTDRSARMLRKLSNVTESIYLVQIEIFNSAGEDVIWKNAHPEYKQYAARYKGEKNADKNNGEFWNWGYGRGLASEAGEVWEDELGSLSADVRDQCDAKEKYLESLKKRRK